MGEGRESLSLRPGFWSCCGTWGKSLLFWALVSPCVCKEWSGLVPGSCALFLSDLPVQVPHADP